jgi:hypothetical protein
MDKTTQELSRVSIAPEIISALVTKGDLSGLDQVQKIQYYNAYCQRLGLDPLTQPFKILSLNGKQVLYCDRSGAQQLNKLHGVSHEIKTRSTENDLFVVTCRASLPDGRFTDSIGAVNVTGLKGDGLANAMMKSETKAKRRATLDLLGLGILDETETETIPMANTVDLKSCDDLRDDYLLLLDQLESVAGGYDAKLLPDNWKKEQNAENFLAAIRHISKILNDEKELRRGTITPHTVADIGKAVKERADRDDFQEARKSKV